MGIVPGYGPSKTVVVLRGHTPTPGVSRYIHLEASAQFWTVRWVWKWRVSTDCTLMPGFPSGKGKSTQPPQDLSTMIEVMGIR